MQEQLSIVRSTDILVAMHGSGMTNLIFQKGREITSNNKDGATGSTVIELFPFGFTRPTYQWIAAKVGVDYVKWENTQRSNTRFHPEVLNSFPTLSRADRDHIITAPRV
jgi:hypothetical protein